MPRSTPNKSLRDYTGQAKKLGAMDYTKYYYLEKFLFEEVNRNFHCKGFLTPEDFFCIVIWKANRAKTKIKKKLLKYGPLSETIKRITSQIFKAPEPREKLRILLKVWKFGLPMATAILTVLYPKDFTIYDVRVRSQLKLKEIYGIKPYFDKFLPTVKQNEYGKSLRDTDRYLWGKSFYEDLEKFLRKN